MNNPTVNNKNDNATRSQKDPISIDTGATAVVFDKSIACKRVEVTGNRDLPFYIELTKKLLRTNEVVEITGSALEMTTAVIITETLRNDGHITSLRTYH